MRRLFASLLLLCAPLAPARAQDEFAAFRASIDQKLRAHPFFTKVTMSVVERPPFLFYIEKAPDGSSDYELAVVNGYLPFLRELTTQFEGAYVQPAGLSRTADAPGFGVAVLSSAGRYLDFRTAIGDPSLANARAHYTPSLRLAVTYQDTFARHNTNSEERHALLHEFVHALQHAHGKGGLMPKPVWYNEGLADYRASCSNLASSLREPPLQHRHVQALGFGYGNPAGRFYIAPLADLVSANSYQEVVEQAKKRNNAEVRGDVLLSLFYSQAEMFVRFLHEADGGKHRAAFLQYVKSVQDGDAGLAAFQRAFVCSTGPLLASFEAEWIKWLDGMLRASYPTLRDLTKAQAGAGGSVPCSPPVAYDTRGLGWSAADLDERFAGARRSCAMGDYEGAASLLPSAADGLSAQQLSLLQREQKRIAALGALRDAVLADYEQKKGQLAVVVGGAAVRGRFVRREPAGLVLLVGKAETTVPLATMTPAVLVREGNRLKKFDGSGRWLEVWLRWLQGQKLASLKGLLALDYPTMVDLRGDLVGDLDATAGGAATALATLLSLPQVEESKPAAEALWKLQAVVRANAASPVLRSRKEAIDRLARAFAERAFRTDDFAALGIGGAPALLDDGRVRVRYADASQAPTADFTPVSAEELKQFGEPLTRLAYSGPSGLVQAGKAYHLVGSTQVRWAVPLSGRQEVEFEFQLQNAGEFAVMLCVDKGGMLVVDMSGGVVVVDESTNILDRVGGGAELFLEKQHKLRVVHDGVKTVQVSVDGKVTANVTNVGARLRGELRLLVHSSNPVQLSGLSVSGKPDPADPQPLRDRYVQRVLEALWP